MAMNVSRWLRYARAKLDAAVASGNEDLDRLEAAQEAERAERPWLGADRDAPPFDEAKARIRWEAEAQAKQAATSKEGGDGRAASGSRGQPAGEEGASPPSPAKGDPTAEASAEEAAARLVLDARAKESAARLDQIRHELGLASPDEPPPDA